MPLLGDVSQAAPKVIFDADTASPTSNNNRAFYDGRFHIAFPRMR
jgi:hypothetical protein